MTQKQTHITWGIIVVILLGVIVYIALANKNDYQPVTENQPVNNEVKNVEKTELTQIELNSDWKTYTNSQFSFEFKYPKDWYIVGKHTLVNNDAQLLSNYEKEEDNNLPNLKDDAENIFFKTYTVAKNTTLDDLKPKTNLVSFEKFFTKEGLEARKVVIYSEDHPVGNHSYFIFLQNNRVIHFSLGSMSEDQISLLEKILGTYTFLSVEVSEFKKYINTKNGLEFEYPTDGKIGDSDSDNVRIDNLPNYEIGMFPEGKFLLQLAIDTTNESCKDRFKTYKKVMIGDVEAYRGVGVDGPYAGTFFLVCIPRDGKNINLSVIDGSKSGAIANRVFDSLKFLK